MDNRRNYCCYPYRRHKRRIYLSLRVLSATVIAKHPSLPLKTGDVMCCNCLTAITHTVDTSVGSTSSMISDECPGPSNLASPPGTEPTTKICGTLCSTESSEGSDNDHQLDDTATELHKINAAFAIQGISLIKNDVVIIIVKHTSFKKYKNLTKLWKRTYSFLHRCVA